MVFEKGNKDDSSSNPVYETLQLQVETFIWHATYKNGQFDILTGGGGSFVTLSPGSSEKMRITSTGNVGIGTTSPTSKLDVAGGDIELDDVAAGIIMRSPDGTKYRITVANGGTLTVTAV